MASRSLSVASQSAQQSHLDVSVQRLGRRNQDFGTFMPGESNQQREQFSFSI